MLSLFDEPFQIDGKYVMLTPVQLSDLDDVYSVAIDPSVWKFNLKWVRDFTKDGIEHYVRNLVQERGVRHSVPFIARNKQTGVALGVAKYDGIMPRHERLEVSQIWIGEPNDSLQWTPRILHDLADHAFIERAAQRLGMLIDKDNLILRESAERVGFVLEGVLRQYYVYPDGHAGDFACYSLLSDEWSAIKPALGAL